MDHDDLVIAVRVDVEAGLGAAFAPLGPEAFSELPDLASRHLADGDAGLVAWELRGRHVGAFWGVPPTGREVRVRGATVVTGLDDTGRIGSDTRFHRFVDWAGVLAQLGLVPGARPGTGGEVLRVGVPSTP